MEYTYRTCYVPLLFHPGVWAAAPTGLSITVTAVPGSDVTPHGDGKYYAVGGNAKLTCAASGGDPEEWRFLKDGGRVGGRYFDHSAIFTVSVNVPASRSYSCTARDSSRSESTETPPFVILTMSKKNDFISCCYEAIWP